MLEFNKNTKYVCYGCDHAAENEIKIKATQSKDQNTK